jgi:hypothetical protein
MPATLSTYPDYQAQVQELVEQHRELRKDDLHLAVYFGPTNRKKSDIYLFEVVEDFGGGRIDPEKKLFTFAYGSTPGLPLPEGVRLWMVLTNPEELDAAIQQNWARVAEIRKAKDSRRAIVLHADAKGKKLWNKIK